MQGAPCPKKIKKKHTHTSKKKGSQRDLTKFENLLTKFTKIEKNHCFSLLKISRKGNMEEKILRVIAIEFFKTLTNLSRDI